MRAFLIAMRVTITAVLTLFVTFASAQKANVDWKYFGGAVVSGKTVRCFFDANSIDLRTSGLVRVWTKCMDEKEMSDFDYSSDLGKKIIKASAEKIAHYYVPPYALIDDVSFDAMVNMVGSEQLADLSYIQPFSSIFYEFNCPEKMYRELSIHIRDSRGTDTPSNWQHTPPEDNAANLNRLLCDERVRNVLEH